VKISVTLWHKPKITYTIYMFAGKHTVLKLRSFNVSMKTSFVGEHGTANSISTSTFSQISKLGPLFRRSCMYTRMYIYAYTCVCETWRTACHLTPEAVQFISHLQTHFSNIHLIFTSDLPWSLKCYSCELLQQNFCIHLLCCICTMYVTGHVTLL